MSMGDPPSEIPGSGEILQLEDEVARLKRELFDRECSNDAWALEVDQLKAKLATAQGVARELYNEAAANGWSVGDWMDLGEKHPWLEDEE